MDAFIQTPLSINGKTYRLMRAAEDDLPAIVALYNQGVGVANADFAPVSVAQKRAWFLAHQKRTRPILLVKDGDATVAWASLSDLYDRPAYEPSVEISVYVDRAYHRQKIGAALLDRTLDCARRLGIANVVALIFAHNAASLALFAKFGFVQWGLLPKVCLSQGKMADVAILGKALCPPPEAL